MEGDLGTNKTRFTAGKKLLKMSADRLERQIEIVSKPSSCVVQRKKHHSNHCTMERWRIYYRIAGKIESSLQII